MNSKPTISQLFYVNRFKISTQERLLVKSIKLIFQKCGKILANLCNLVMLTTALISKRLQELRLRVLLVYLVIVGSSYENFAKSTESLSATILSKI